MANVNYVRGIKAVRVSYPLTFHGGSFMGTSDDPQVLTYSGTKVLEIQTTCASTHASTSYEPVLINNVMTGTGQVGGRVKINLDISDVVLGGWANALKVNVDCNTSGRATGLLSSICAEMELPASDVSGAGGGYAPLEVEFTAPESHVPAAQTAFVYFNAGGNATALTALNAAANLFWLGTAIVDGTGNLYYGNTIRNRIGTTSKYMLLGDAEFGWNYGTAASPTSLTYNGAKAMTIYTTCASTNGGTNYEPVLINTVMTGAGQVGGRVKINMSTNYALGGWANALKAQVECNTNGRATGLLSAFCGEIVLPASDVSGLGGTYAALEAEINCAASCTPSHRTSFIYFGTGGDSSAITAYQDAGCFFELVGIGTPSSATNVFHSTGAVSATHGLRCRIDNVDYDILLKVSTYA